MNSGCPKEPYLIGEFRSPPGERAILGETSHCKASAIFEESPSKLDQPVKMLFGFVDSCECKEPCVTWGVHIGVTWRILLLLLHPFNGLFSITTWLSQYQKGKTDLDLNEASHDGVL